MPDYQTLLVDAPAEFVRRISLDRPDKRNAISNLMRTELLDALHAHDRDESVRVTILRGNGPCFSAGYDLASDLNSDQPYFTADGDGQWSRHVSEGWLGIWDLAKPVIAQVHGYAIAGGSELAAACDLLYIAEDASVSNPVARLLSPPDMQFQTWLMGMRNAMEMALTGDSISGREAVTQGFANRAWPAAELDERVLERAVRVAGIASDLNQLNKRSVHRAMEIMGARTAIRAGSDLMALATHQKSVRKHIASALESIKNVSSESKEKKSP